MSVDELNRLAIQIKTLEEQIERLQGQLQLLENSIINLENTNITIDNMKEVKEDQETLIPIGNISFIKGKITDTKNVIINLGSDVFADVNIDFAKENINNRIAELKKAQQELAGRLQRYINQMNNLRPRFQELYTQMQNKGVSPSPS